MPAQGSLAALRSTALPFVVGSEPLLQARTHLSRRTTLASEDGPASRFASSERKHLDFLALAPRLAVLGRLRDLPRYVSRHFVHAPSDLANRCIRAAALLERASRAVVLASPIEEPHTPSVLVRPQPQNGLPLRLPLERDKEKRAATSLLQPVDFVGGVDGARTRDPRRDRPVF